MGVRQPSRPLNSGQNVFALVDAGAAAQGEQQREPEPVAPGVFRFAVAPARGDAGHIVVGHRPAAPAARGCERPVERFDLMAQVLHAVVGRQ
jgi:hypothetical protein